MHYFFSDFKLGGNASLVACLIRTSQFKVWYPGYEGGANSYLSKFDPQYFYNYIIETVDYSNCVPAVISSNFAFNLKKKIFVEKWILLNRDHRLIFNMDETMIDSNRRLKVVAPNKAILITIVQMGLSSILLLFCPTKK